MSMISFAKLSLYVLAANLEKENQAVKTSKGKEVVSLNESNPVNGPAGGPNIFRPFIRHFFFSFSFCLDGQRFAAARQNCSPGGFFH